MEHKWATLERIRRQYGWTEGHRVSRWSREMLAAAMQSPEKFGLPASLSSENGGIPFEGRYGLIKREVLRRLGVPSWIGIDQLKVDGQNVTIFDLLVMPAELLDQRLDGGSFLHTLSFGRPGANPWRVQALDRSLPVPHAVTEQCLELLGKWQKVFPKEDTFAEQQFEVPSLLVRFDCVYHEAIGLGVYEIEDRPAGVGITLVVNQQFKALFNQLRSEWPEFSVVVSPLRLLQGGDDHLWAKEISFEEAKGSAGLLWVRAEPWELVFHELAPRSVSTIKTEGLKSYGVPLGLWSNIDNKEVESGIVQLPWDQGFCIKPLQGSKTQNVFIWDPKVQLFHGKERALAHVKSLGRAHLQRFIPPMPLKIGDMQYNVIYRIFFGWSPKRKEWIPLGGEWDARPAPHSLIHGALDAVTGPSPLA